MGGLGKRCKTKEVEEAPKTARLSQDGLSDLKGPLNLTYASEGPYRELEGFVADTGMSMTQGVTQCAK